MIDLKKIKLIIWDLDETFWGGVLSEGNIVLSDANIRLVKVATDCGVIQSICSKNDEEKVNDILSKIDLKDYFVFKSIDWTNKGPRVKAIIDDMHLRYTNVLFIDDNPTNRAEVEHFCPDIMTADIDILPNLSTFFGNLQKSDQNHSRLNQYKVLEKKREVRKNLDSTEDFLKQSNIQVEIKYDCLDNLDRIYDLIQRANQLNFTKVRSSKEEIVSLLTNSLYRCGYVTVSDIFGDYGIVGFFAVRDNNAIHFVFSCRTLGMGIEQYVYCEIGKPKVVIAGEVVSELDNPIVTWINNNVSTDKKSKEAFTKKIVVHGPCDLSSIFAYIEDSPNIIKEFNYVNENGISIEQRNCTTHIVEYKKFSDEIRESEIVKKLPFYDKDMFKTAIFDADNEFVILSLFTDPCLACYKEKQTGLIVCFADAPMDLTDESRADEFISSPYKLHNCKLTVEDLDFIRQNYEYLGRIQPSEILDNIKYIYNNIANNCKLILTLQSETQFINTSAKYSIGSVRPEKLDNTPRHIYNKNLNDILRQWAKGKDDVLLLDFNDYIKGQESFNDHISHFKREVYYQMSQNLVSIIKNNSEISFKNKSHFYIFTQKLSNKIRHLAYLFKNKLKSFVERKK
ncbi:MAG: HAD-IIIC family phosphatase [Clostridia bacterium]|nr:HAD-IIIC family phosphatase [Clostridia bacterium]